MVRGDVAQHRRVPIGPRDANLVGRGRPPEANVRLSRGSREVTAAGQQHLVAAYAGGRHLDTSVDRAAPAIVRFVGGTVPDALATTERMYQLTLAENPAMAIPIMGFRGAPTGIDVLKVARTGWLPQINTGMAGRIAGTGQVGAGLVQPPQECFEKALVALAEAARPR